MRRTGAERPNRGLLRLLLPLVAFVLQSLFWPTLQPYVWFLFYPAATPSHLS